jgi:anthranilate synthase/aminodeoxychorismate synthase-like glutamine amidotransferase
MTKIFLLDNHDSFTYNLAAMFSKFQKVKLNISFPENTNIKNISEFDKIIFSPGPGLPSESPVMDELIEKYKSSKQFLGVCLGHQAIALHFGAKLLNYKLVKHGMIKQLIFTEEESVLFKNIPNKSKIGVYHSWYVDKSLVPRDIKITAVNEDGIIMAMEHLKYNIQTVQFHPESFITEYGQNMIENWIKA